MIVSVGGAGGGERDIAEAPLTRALSYSASRSDMAQISMLGKGRGVTTSEERARPSAGAAAEYRLRSTESCDDDGGGWLRGSLVFSFLSLSLFFLFLFSL